MVSGYTDPRGTEEYKQPPERRAQAVVSALAAHGVVDAEVIIEPHGESDADELPSEWPADRRASVDVER